MPSRSRVIKENSPWLQVVRGLLFGLPSWIYIACAVGGLAIALGVSLAR
jgi:hypothetical protein